MLRMLVVKHLYGWSDEATARWVSDSRVWRQFCRVYVAPMPDDTTLLRWVNLIPPETLHRLRDHIAANSSGISTPSPDAARGHSGAKTRQPHVSDEAEKARRQSCSKHALIPWGVPSGWGRPTL
jgi:hypothetical protein